jgi:hypothetical protein
MLILVTAPAARTAGVLIVREGKPLHACHRLNVGRMVCVSFVRILDGDLAPPATNGKESEMIDAVWINGKSVLVSTLESAFMERHRYLTALEEIVKIRKGTKLARCGQDEVYRIATAALNAHTSEQVPANGDRCGTCNDNKSLHYCKEGQLKPYPTVVCSMCMGVETKTFPCPDCVKEEQYTSIVVDGERVR